MNSDVRPRTRRRRLGDSGSSVSSLPSPTVVVVGVRQAVGVGAPLGAAGAERCRQAVRGRHGGPARSRPREAGHLDAGKGAPLRTVAIACQGGGSHTAFTGGVLQRLLADGQHRIVALSGRSGGAVCALLAWYGLQTGGAAEAGRLLERFWQANSAPTLSDRVANAGLVGLARLEGRVSLPTVSPYAYPEIGRAAFTSLLTSHVDVVRLAQLAEAPPPDQPLLLLGAADILTGDFKAFSSRRREITVDA